MGKGVILASNGCAGFGIQFPYPIYMETEQLLNFCKQVVLLASIVALAAALPHPVFEYEGQEHTHTQRGTTGDKVEGEYR